MELKQAIEVVSQAINIALSNGGFKATQDVAVIHNALETLKRFESESHAVKELPTKKDK